MALEASCLGCGVRFSYQPSNASGKYCSFVCMISHRRHISAVSGLSLRKLFLRASVHAETTALKVWAAIRKESDDIKYVVLRDLMQEQEAVRAEISRVYAAMSADEKAVVTAEMGRLDKAMSRERTIGIRVECPVCKSVCGANSATCWKCGEGLTDVGPMALREVTR